MLSGNQKKIVLIILSILGFLLVNGLCIGVGFIWFEHLTSNVGKSNPSGTWIESFFSGLMAVILTPFLFLLAFGIPTLLGNLAYFTLLVVWWGFSFFQIKRETQQILLPNHQVITRQTVIAKSSNGSGCLKAVFTVLVLLLIGIVMWLLVQHYYSKQEKQITPTEPAPYMSDSTTQVHLAQPYLDLELLLLRFSCK